jgi:hypothetical protein
MTCSNLWLYIIFAHMSEYHIGDAMKAFLNKSNLKNGVRAVQIENVWMEVMGNTIAKYTDKIQIINSTLFISTSVGPLKHELLFQKDKIIQRVNEALGENVIKEVVIQ